MTHTMTKTGKFFFCVSAMAFLGIGIGLMLYFMLGRTDGLLVYSLDDPYIHLAVAEEILKGDYGINR